MIESTTFSAVYYPHFCQAYKFIIGKEKEIGVQNKIILTEQNTSKSFELEGFQLKMEEVSTDPVQGNHSVW